MKTFLHDAHVCPTADPVFLRSQTEKLVSTAAAHTVRCVLLIFIRLCLF